MKQLNDIFKDVLLTGNQKTDRTGTGTISKFGGMMKFSLQHGMWPIVTGRKVAYKKIAEELEWMIKGITRVQWLNDRDNKIWDGWVGSDGTIGPMYGEQWRNWNANMIVEDDYEKLTEIMGNLFEAGKKHNAIVGKHAVVGAIKDYMITKTKPYQDGGRGGVDQLQYVVDELKNNPDSRRIVVNVWHASLLPKNGLSPSENVDAGKMALAPCHSTWQVNTAEMSNEEILLQYAYTNRGVRSDEHADMVRDAAMQFLFREGLMEVVPVAKGHTATVEQVSIKGIKLANQWREDGKPSRKLSLLCYARSQDLPLGTVFNVGMYSLLAHILAELTNMVPWEYTHFMGDHHIYVNQIPYVMEQMEREPLPTPRVIVDPSMKTIDDFKAENLQVWYESHPAIKYPPAAI